MADRTKIEWTGATWNPVTGCSITSPGCKNCYAMVLAGTRMRSHPSRAGLTDASKVGPVWNGQVRLNEDWLTQPLRWKRPRLIFVCAHGDLFHENVPDAWIDRVFAVMALSPHHTFQVLTKRSARMRAYCNDPSTLGRIARILIDEALIGRRWGFDPETWPVTSIGNIDLPDDVSIAWPLRNVWKGVSAEDQTRAEDRIPHLLNTKSAVHFVSLEPMIGPVDLRALDIDGEGYMDALDPPTYEAEWEHWRDTEQTREEAEESFKDWYDLGHLPIGEMPKGPMHARLAWVIVGGESGPNARPMHPAWAKALRDQCADTYTPFFFKQWGEYAPREACPDAWPAEPFPGMRYEAFSFTDALVHRVGKARAGRALDGIEHNGMPEVRHAA